MSKGAYLIIEHTEALHVIDVNSGNRSNKASNQEDTAMEVNMIAAEIADNCVYVIWVVLS
jgi:ribonuclease G